MLAWCPVEQAPGGQFQIWALPRLPPQWQRVPLQFQDCLLPLHVGECLSRQLRQATGLRRPIQQTKSAIAVVSRSGGVGRNCFAKLDSNRVQCCSSLASLAVDTTTRELAHLPLSRLVANLHVETDRAGEQKLKAQKPEWRRLRKGVLRSQLFPEGHSVRHRHPVPVPSESCQ